MQKRFSTATLKIFNIKIAYRSGTDGGFWYFKFNRNLSVELRF